MGTQLSLFGDEVNDEQPPVSLFESIKHLDDQGEYWLARELQSPLDYVQWRNFEKAIKQAMTACKNSGHRIADHFADISKSIKMPKGASRQVNDYKLTRYACYLIAQNGDPRKKPIADTQTYFAIQTRRQEVADIARLEGKEDRKEFTASAQKSHVTHTPDYAGLTNATYQILFGAAKAELLKELHLDYRQSKKFRDHISTLALRAIQAAEAGASAEFGGLSSLGTKQQIEIVEQYARIFAPAFNQAATKAGVDLLSGDRLLSPIDAIREALQ